MKAFHGDPAVKAKFLDRVRAHRQADEIVRGQYWSGGRGCAVGCTIHGSSHTAYEKQLGIPRAIARLEDVLFERMPLDRAMLWPEAFLSAIPVGADLSLVIPQFLYWILGDEESGVLTFIDREKFPGVVASVTAVTALYRRFLAGESIELEEWRAAEAAAAAAAAGWRAAEAAAGWRAAEAAAGWRAAEAAAQRQSEQLLKILAAAPVQ